MRYMLADEPISTGNRPSAMTGLPDRSRLIPGDRVQDPFLVLEVETRTGDHPHTVLTLGNSTAPR